MKQCFFCLEISDICLDPNFIKFQHYNTDVIKHPESLDDNNKDRANICKDSECYKEYPVEREFERKL